MHAVSGFLVEHGGNIIESQQFGDRLTGRFFMRVDFADRRDAATADELRAGVRARSPSEFEHDAASSGPRGRRTAR